MRNGKMEGENSTENKNINEMKEVVKGRGSSGMGKFKVVFEDPLCRRNINETINISKIPPVAKSMHR